MPAERCSARMPVDDQFSSYFVRYAARLVASVPLSV
jgi:hypothetical protein